MIHICIFSYNRGAFLQNCINSVLQYAPQCRLSVFDDNSNDEATKQVLAALPATINLYQPDTHSSQRHGGLYANMQWALDLAAQGEYLLFIQDDMQLVRPLRDEDNQYITQYFDTFTQAAFLNPVFLKGQRASRDKRITQLSAEFPVYFRHYPTKKHPRGLSYADVVIAHVDRLRQHSWQFSDSEVTNAVQAQQHFGAMGFMLHPFVMFLPQVPVYRGKRKSYAVTLAQRWSGEQPKSFLPLNQTQLNQLLQRNPEVLPVAEQFLHCIDPKIKRPFQYSAVNAYPLLRVLHKIEQWLKR